MASSRSLFDLNSQPNDEDATQEEAYQSNTPLVDIDLNVPIMEEDVESNNVPEILEMPQGEGRRIYRVVSNKERQLIYNTLLQRSENGKIKKNTTKDISSLLSVPLRAVQRIWKQMKETPNGTVDDVCNRRAKNCGRKRVELDLQRIASIPLNQRSTLRSLAASSEMNLSAVHRCVKKGNLRRHSNAIKPYLKEENKFSRLRFCISMLEPSSLQHEPTFVDMYNTVHIDEKWFYMTKQSKKYYLLPDEEDPLRSCQSKNFIGKVMFLAAIARPRFDDQGNEVFSGKIGVFPLVYSQPAARRSRNREAGTLETKAITSVKKETIRAFLIEKVIPAIQAKWPREDVGSTIFIQQDNARTHVQPDDAEFQRAVSQSGFDIRLTFQPANSPDFNVLDLGFFNATQSLQHKECTKTVDELIDAVQRAFEGYEAKKINHVFLTLQLCMRETMKLEGSNRYKIPHINKRWLQRNGLLPSQITCERALVESTLSLLG